MKKYAKIDANQAPPASKKQVKTIANRRKSLESTNLEKKTKSYSLGPKNIVFLQEKRVSQPQKKN